MPRGDNDVLLAFTHICDRIGDNRSAGLVAFFPALPFCVARRDQDRKGSAESAIDLVN